jgi:hypothetical protein
MRALHGPRAHPSHGDEAWRAELLNTLQAIQNVRALIDQNEMETVRNAREAGFSWTEIATRLGVSRQAAWERWHEMEPTEESPGARRRWEDGVRAQEDAQA